MAIGLSMDAFSLALSIGTTNPNQRIILIQSLFIGIFHFFMPLLGTLINLKIISKTNIIVGIIFLILSIEMYNSKNKEEQVFIKSILTALLIAFTVSIDSLIVGIALNINGTNILPCAIIFSITSFIFTFIGLKIGVKLREKYREKAIVLGSIILLIISIKYFIS